MRALDKDPGARGSAAQFQADIERVLRSAQVVPAPEKPRSKAWIWILAIVIVALAALAAAWALGAFGGSTANDVTVPDVTGLTAARAEAALTEAGFKTGKVTQMQTTAGPQGTVVSQSPAGGEQAAEGSAVDLEVAGKPTPTATPVAVPDVVREFAGGSRVAAHRRRLHSGRRADAERYRVCRQRDLPGPAGRGSRFAGQQGEHRGLHGPLDPDPVDVGQSMS